MLQTHPGLPSHEEAESQGLPLVAKTRVAGTLPPPALATGRPVFLGVMTVKHRD